MDHIDAARKLRILIQEHGYLDHTDALNFILDELREARKDNGRLVAERDEARREVLEMLKASATVAVESVKKIADKQARLIEALKHLPGQPHP